MVMEMKKVMELKVATTIQLGKEWRIIRTHMENDVDIIQLLSGCIRALFGHFLGTKPGTFTEGALSDAQARDMARDIAAGASSARDAIYPALLHCWGCRVQGVGVKHQVPTSASLQSGSFNTWLR